MYRIGVDLGGTNIVAGVVDGDYQIVSKGQLKTNLPRSAEEIFDDIAKASRIAVEAAGLTMEDVHSVGLGTPGTVNQNNGTIEFSNNLDFQNVPAKKMLEDRLQRPVFMDNDANCAALGEALAGAGKGVRDFVAITLGTGVGSGVVINGKIYNGANNAAAELGHTVIMVDGEQCTCGRRGCWEAYASATALIKQTKDEMRHNHDSVMWQLVSDNIDAVNGRTAFDAMRAGDAAGKRVVDRYIYYIACGIINTINALQPEMICIGGGISHEGDTLLDPLRKHVERERYSIYSHFQTKLCRAVLGNDSGVIGAACLD